ncbi:43101_t:CDS:1, partial [Gigaspora margarita]
IPSSDPLGCYVFNNISVDSLNGLSSLNLPPIYRDRYGFIMNPGLCITRCTDFLFEVAALRNGSQCQCGHSINFMSSYIKTNDSICDVKCVGNLSYNCGGKDSYTVYNTKDGVLGHPLPSISISKKMEIIKNQNNDSRYQQCVKDSPYCNQRLLNGTISPLELATMTVDKCIEFCRQNNFEFAGLEIGTQCFCAHNYDHVNQLSSDECSTSCAGDNNQICGGPLALSVYRTSEIKNNPPLQIILPIVFGGVLLLTLIALAAWFIYKHPNKNRDNPPKDNEERRLPLEG